MTALEGRMSPEIINAMLIWQQPHPLVFAELEYRHKPTPDTLEKWAEVVQLTADFMASFAFWNASTGLYDLGPPMFPVSENTEKNFTTNTAFEVCYWHLGFEIASTWMKRMGRRVPAAWYEVDEKLAPRPIQNGTYVIYEGIDNSWSKKYTGDHPSMSGMYGWLPMTVGLDLRVVNTTMNRIESSWQFDKCWGWDFPMLAMQAARMGYPNKAVDWLLHPLFTFDDIGMPGGGGRLDAPYFPGSGGLLYAIALMAAGWDGSDRHTPGFGVGWDVKWEGLSPAL